MEFVTHLKIHVTKQIYFYTNDCTGDNYANYWSTKLNYSSTELFENPSGAISEFRYQNMPFTETPVGINNNIKLQNS